jgi:hypothetical protein
MAAEGKSDRESLCCLDTWASFMNRSNQKRERRRRAELTRMVDMVFSFSHALHLILPLPEIIRASEMCPVADRYRQFLPGWIPGSTSTDLRVPGDELCIRRTPENTVNEQPCVMKSIRSGGFPYETQAVLLRRSRFTFFRSRYGPKMWVLVTRISTSNALSRACSN